jgi:hypothetical protein
MPLPRSARFQFGQDPLDELDRRWVVGRGAGRLQVVNAQLHVAEIDVGDAPVQEGVRVARLEFEGS